MATYEPPATHKTEANDPLCTVVTVTRNNLRGLMKTMASLRGLDERFEHIIVDGASSDNSVGWARSHRALNQTYVVSEPDSGIYEAMNKGLNLARGEFVHFLNAGDTLVSPRALEQCVGELLDKRGTWLIAGMLVRSQDGSVALAKRAGRYSWIRETFLRYRVGHPATLARTQLLRQLGGFDVTYGIAGDFKLLTALGRAHRPVVSAIPLAEFELGGLSDRSPLLSLTECSRARGEVLLYGRFRSGLDRLWTLLSLTPHVLHRLVSKRGRHHSD